MDNLPTMELFTPCPYNFYTPLKKGQPLNNGRKTRPQCVHYSEVLLSVCTVDLYLASSLSPVPRCEWHEERENKYCSLAVVNKYSYVLADSLCPKYNISLANGHLPPEVYTHTVEPPNKGPFGANSFGPYREVVPISEVK